MPKEPSEPQELSARSADAYESAYMKDGEVVLQREKMTWPWYMHLFILLVGSLVIGLPLLSAAPLFVPLLAGSFLLAMWLTLSVLRVTVTRGHVHVQYGLIGPKIPISSIEQCQAEDYDFWKYGGYGIRYSLTDGSWAFNMLGDKGKAVRIHYRTPSGRLRKILLASRHPNALADAIQQARRAQGHQVEPMGDDLLAEQLDALLYSEEQAVTAPQEGQVTEVEQVEQATQRKP